MNNRIKKKLSKKIALSGLREFEGAFNDCYTKEWSNVEKVYVIGGGPDYWGEYDDPEDLIFVAKEVIMWEFGFYESEESWPKWINKRLTGKELMRYIKLMQERKL